MVPPLFSIPMLYLFTMEQTIEQGKHLKEIDVDFISELKRMGKVLEANELIKAHQRSLIKNRDQAKQEMHSFDQKIIRHYLKRNKLCLSCYKKIVSDNINNVRCKTCLEKRRKKYKNAI